MSAGEAAAAAGFGKLRWACYWMSRRYRCCSVADSPGRWTRMHGEQSRIFAFCPL